MVIMSITRRTDVMSIGDTPVINLLQRRLNGMHPTRISMDVICQPGKAMPDAFRQSPQPIVTLRSR